MPLHAQCLGGPIPQDKFTKQGVVIVDANSPTPFLVSNYYQLAPRSCDGHVYEPNPIILAHEFPDLISAFAIDHIKDDHISIATLELVNRSYFDLVSAIRRGFSGV
jgi:hypothetical protein